MTVPDGGISPLPSAEGSILRRVRNRLRRPMVWVGAILLLAAVIAIIVRETLVIPERAKLIERWDSNAITARFDSATPAGGTYVFRYILANHTDRQYTIEAVDRPRLFTVRRRGGALDDATAFMLDLPVFIPPGRTQSIRIRYTLATGGMTAQPLRTAFPDLGGFEIFDELRQYEIVCPIR
jgi:hypothetical protein